MFNAKAMVMIMALFALADPVSERRALLFDEFVLPTEVVAV